MLIQYTKTPVNTHIERVIESVSINRVSELSRSCSLSKKHTSSVM